MVVCVTCVCMFGLASERVSGTSAALIWSRDVGVLCFLQGASFVLVVLCVLLVLSVLRVNFPSVAHGGHEFFLGAQLPSALVAPAKKVEHFVPLAVELRFESGQDCNSRASERLVALEDVEIPNSCGVRMWQVVGEQAPEKRIEEV